MDDKYITSRDSYGILINPDALLHRKWFKEFVRLQGINVLYKYPLKNATYKQVGEFVADYSSPQLVGCMFEEHPSQRTTKRLGWVHELSDEASIIHLPYDTENLQEGALVIVPSAFDNTQGRVFRITKMSSVSMIYPWAISCEIVPELKNNFDKSQLSHKKDTFNLLNEEEDE